MITIRKTLALAALLTLAGLIVLSDARSPGGSEDRWVVSFWGFLPLLLVSMVGLVRGRAWARWLGLAGGIAVLPWAMALLLKPYGLSAVRPATALAAALVLIASLIGRSMFDEFEGRATRVDWRGRGMSLIRWTIVLNLASVLALYLFVVAVQYRHAWHLAIPAATLVGLVAGVLLLAYQKTGGLLLVALCCVAFVPAGAYFVSREASSQEEAVLFAIVFLPGVLMGWASLLRFGRPILRYLREG